MVRKGKWENGGDNVRFTEVGIDSPRNAAISPSQTEDGDVEIEYISPIGKF